MLYLAHCTFLLTFPAHLLLLRIFSPSSTPLRPALAQLTAVWHVQLTGEQRRTGEKWPWLLPTAACGNWPPVLS